MLTVSCVSTHDLHGERRVALVRDTAAHYFNLDVNLGDAVPAAVSADIHIARGALAGVMEVNTSWSMVERNRARARAAPSNNLLVYLIKQGGSGFENAKGEQFVTAPGSVVVGSQDAVYKGVAAPGQDWRFHALSIPEHLLAFSAPAIQHGGFQQVRPDTPLSGLLTSYLTGLSQELPRMDAPAAAAALRALDQLLAGALACAPRAPEELARVVEQERLALALKYIDSHLESPMLTPTAIALNLGVSLRQLHRAFEGAGHSVADAIRQRRIERARVLVLTRPELSITEIALCCGFDSLATFYRQFKARLGVTASELRH
ncbi:helix-turn-helix transcriptional regulator [Duganella violaceipulchra]|uniref:AraC family transcriptional regulator n=1 Tax=Duganella violaceipulchra TaxID=2849652 RepID=A0AA41H6T3_9BURK|nr:AraC family transcriptional regulator [Duganella violaceicalia]MBV6321510.1 AraC family transcriptional regulator [Duganella violaceicalia]MCP2008233.1 AraC-like DNA-binding protein [Duganella violaceicalia]